MKNCDEIKELLSLYLDNELHENDRKKVVKHLEGCNECKAELENIKDIVEEIGSIEELELPDNFSQSLHEKLVQSADKGTHIQWPNKGRIFRWASTVVAGFVLMFLFINSGYLGYISVPLTNAYVNDASLEMVDKDTMNSFSAGQNTKSTFGSIFNNDTAIKSSASNSAVKPSDDVSANVDSDSETPSTKTADQDIITNPYETPQPTEKITLVVDNTSSSVSQIISTIQNSGGKVIETAALYDSVTGNPNNQRNFTVTLSQDEYDSIISSLGKVGTVYNEIEMNSDIITGDRSGVSTGTKNPSVPTSTETSTTGVITISLTVQEK